MRDGHIESDVRNDTWTDRTSRALPTLILPTTGEDQPSVQCVETLAASANGVPRDGLPLFARPAPTGPRSLLSLNPTGPPPSHRAPAVAPRERLPWQRHPGAIRLLNCPIIPCWGHSWRCSSLPGSRDGVDSSWLRAVSGCTSCVPSLSGAGHHYRHGGGHRHDGLRQRQHGRRPGGHPPSGDDQRHRPKRQARR